MTSIWSYAASSYETDLLNALRPRQDGRHFADDIFKCIFLNENVWIPVKISLKFVPKGAISNIPALVQIMAWRRSGDKPLSEPMMSLRTHICVTRPQWVNSKMGWLYITHHGYPYPDGVYTPAWSVHSKATLLPLPLECTLQPHSEYHRCTLGCHSMDLVKSLTNRNTLQRHFKCTPDGVYTPLPLL